MKMLTLSFSWIVSDPTLNVKAGLWAPIEKCCEATLSPDAFIDLPQIFVSANLLGPRLYRG